jgi:hypothetical protein
MPNYPTAMAWKLELIDYFLKIKLCWTSIHTTRGSAKNSHSVNTCYQVLEKSEFCEQPFSLKPLSTYFFHHFKFCIISLNRWNVINLP